MGICQTLFWGREVMNAVIDRAAAQDLEQVLALLNSVPAGLIGVLVHFWLMREKYRVSA